MNILHLPENYKTIDIQDYKKTLEAFCMYVDKLGIDFVIDNLEAAQRIYTEQQNVN